MLLAGITPTNFKAVALSKSQVSLAWNAPTNPEGQIDKYVYTIKSEKQSEKSMTAYSNGNTAYNVTIGDLTPSTDYTVTVKTFNKPLTGQNAGGGGGGIAATLTVKTLSSG